MRDKPIKNVGVPAQIVATAEVAAAVHADRGDKTPPKPPRRTGRALNKGEVHEVFRRFREAEPEPKGELTSLNTFTFLVAVVLSAQATDVGVNKATPALFALAETPEKMLALGEDRVRELIKTVGLFRTKAKNVNL